MTRGLLQLLVLSLLVSSVAMAGRGPVEFTGASKSSASDTVTVRVEASREFVTTRSSDGAEIARGMLPLVPGNLLVADSGERLVLLDAWGGGRSNKGLRIVDAQGDLVAAFTIEQLFSPEVRAGFPQSASGPMWRADVWIDDKLGVVAIVSGGNNTGYSVSGGIASIAVAEPGASPETGPPPAAVVVRSLADGRVVEPWGALARRMAHPKRSRLVRTLMNTPGALSISDGLLRSLFDDDGQGRRALAVELAVRNDGPEANEVLAAALADCECAGSLRTRAATALLGRGDERGAPVVLLATGSPRRKAFAGRSRTGVCLHGLDNEWAEAGAIPGLPPVMGDAVDALLVRKALEHPHGHVRVAAMKLLLERDRSPQGWQEAARHYLERGNSTREGQALRSHVIAALLAENPDGAIDLADSLTPNDGLWGPGDWNAFALLAAGGRETLSVQLRLIDQSKPEVAREVIKQLLARLLDSEVLTAIGERLLRAPAGRDRAFLTRPLARQEWDLPHELVPTIEQMARDALARDEAKQAYQLLARGGHAGRNVLQSEVLQSRFGTEAALLLDPPDGTTIHTCMAALEQVALSTDDRTKLFKRIWRVVQNQGLPAPPSPGADRIAELYARELDSGPHRYVAMVLAHAGEPGRKALAGLLLRFPDDDSDQVKRIVGALKDSVRGEVPAAVESRPGSGWPTSKVDRWRAWAEKLSP